VATLGSGTYAFGLLDSACDFVLDGGLALLRLWLGDTSGGLLGGWRALLTRSPLLDGVGGDGREDAGLGVAGGSASGGHFDVWVVGWVFEDSYANYRLVVG
jgi:hypothetical protein